MHGLDALWASMTTDRLGVFAFQRVEPGTYVVELISSDQSVLAASQLLNANAGEAVTAIVKLPLSISPLAAVIGHDAAQALAIASVAAASGVLGTQAVGQDVTGVR